MKSDILHYSTYFDRNYLYRGLALYRSLVRHSPPFVFWVLCFDDETHNVLSRLALPKIRLISLREFEQADEALVRVKQNRSRVEYYFTCTPLLPLYIFNRDPQVDLVTYLDADLFFYNSPQPIYRELGNRSILIVGHRFPPHLRHLEIWGVYNVGLVSFRRDDQAYECLHLWRDQCLEWCHTRLENGRMADQKYLDDWPSRFSRVVVLQYKGAGLAPWNLSNYKLRIQDGQVFVDSDPLVFYHFHALKVFSRSIYYSGLDLYGHTMSSVVKRGIYLPYIWELREVMKWLDQLASQDPVLNSLTCPRFPTPSLRGIIRIPSILLHRSILVVMS